MSKTALLDPPKRTVSWTLHNRSPKLNGVIDISPMAVQPIPSLPQRTTAFDISAITTVFTVLFRRGSVKSSEPRGCCSNLGFGPNPGQTEPQPGFAALAPLDPPSGSIRPNLGRTPRGGRPRWKTTNWLSLRSLATIVVCWTGMLPVGKKYDGTDPYSILLSSYAMH